MLLLLTAVDWFYEFKIYIDNESTICIVKNPVYHSKTKHIEIRHHFIRDSYEKMLIQTQAPRNHIGSAHAQTRFETASKRSSDPPLSIGHIVRSEEDKMEQKTNFTDFVPPTPYDSPLLGCHTPGSDEGRPNINELINLCTQLSNRVLALEQFKTAQDLVIKRLQKKLKILENKQRERTPGMKLFKIGTSKKNTLDKENVSKQRRDESNGTDELNLFNKGNGKTKVFDYTIAAKKDAVEPVSTTDDAVNAANVIPDVSADGPSTMIHDVEEESRRATPPSIVQIQDKGKGKMVKREPISNNPIKAQIQRHAEVAQRLFKEEQAQFEREQRIAREKATEQEAKDAALIKQIEDVQARIDADALLAERLQQEEREQFAVDEQARMLVDLIAERKMFFAAQRAKQIRNKPPTKSHLKNKMVTDS
nr:retrovirus-related Pol polyprotein from transposon TNT 1-94 [Tanacetum cinerariifolium]